jgi:hypothetical protein
MASFGGLISGVLGRTAEGYGKVADMEMRKQGELDLKKQLLEAETEKQLRMDEIKRERDVTGRLAEETRVQSPAYLAAQAKADADKFKALVAAGVPEAEAQATVAKGTAAAKARKDLAPINAEAGDVEFEANKALEGKKATAVTAAKVKEAGDLAKDPDYLTSVAKLATAAKDPDIKMNQARADALAGRSSGGGAGKITVRSTYTDDQGQKIAVLSDGSTKVLGKAADYDKTLSKLITDMSKNSNKFDKLPEAEKRKQAEQRLRGQIVVPSSGPKDLSKYERDKALND